MERRRPELRRRGARDRARGRRRRPRRPRRAQRLRTPRPRRRREVAGAHPHRRHLRPLRCAGAARQSLHSTAPASPSTASTPPAGCWAVAWSFWSATARPTPTWSRYDARNLATLGVSAMIGLSDTDQVLAAAPIAAAAGIPFVTSGATSPAAPRAGARTGCSSPASATTSRPRPGLSTPSPRWARSAWPCSTTRTWSTPRLLRSTTSWRPSTAYGGTVVFSRRLQHRRARRLGAHDAGRPRGRRLTPAER